MSERATSKSVRSATLIALFALQAVCVATLVGDVVGDLAAPTRDPGEGVGDDAVETIIVATLVAGLGFTAYEMWSLLARHRKLEDQVKAASGAFQDVLEAHFERWALTAAERDVAVLAIKGLSVADIAAVRGSREGTVKAQCSAIYRKAGVTGRPQLISLFIEELMGDGLEGVAARTADVDEAEPSERLAPQANGDA